MTVAAIDSGRCDRELGIPVLATTWPLSLYMIGYNVPSGRSATAGKVVEAQIPFGGMKASGYGRFGGRAAINEFTELRWIETEPQHYPF